MKKTQILLVVLLSTLFASFALAEDDIAIRNDVTATGGASNQNQNQDQGQNQDQQQKQVLNNYNRRNHITATSGPSGNFVAIPPIVETEVYLPFYGVVYSVEELTYIRESSSYGDRPGLFSFFTSPVNRTLHMKRYEGKISASDSLELVDMNSCMLVKTLGVYNGTGSYGAPMEAILAYTLLQAKEETNAMYFEVKYKIRKNPKVFGLAIGSGAAASVLSGGGNDKGAGSMSVGAVIGTSTAYLQYAFDVEVRAVRVVAKARVETPVYVAPPASPAPAPPVCSPDVFLERLRVEIEACYYCPDPCLNNEVHRKQAGDIYLDLYHCTGNKGYLLKAIEQYRIAERDFLNGWEPKKAKGGKKTWTRTLRVAQEVIYKARYNWTWAERELNGPEAQIKLMVLKNLNRAPERYEELKR